MSVQVFRNNRGQNEKYNEALLFWSTAEELPEELQRACRDLYTFGYVSSLECLVETGKGYGIALLNEYDKETAKNSHLSMDVLFDTVVKDAHTIAADPLFAKAEVFVGEFSGFDECHELVVVFPADTPVHDFRMAAAKLDELAYQACGIREAEALDEQIAKANHEAVRLGSDTVVSVGRFAENDEVREAVSESDVVRNRTLDVCYRIPGYEKLPAEDKNALYDLVKKSIVMAQDKEVVPEALEL